MKGDTNKQESGSRFFNSYLRIAVVFFAGFTVFLTVSTLILIMLTKETREVSVPDVTGKSFVNVYNSLSRKGLRPEVKFQEVRDIENGLILAQHPEAGEIVRYDAVLKLVVSRNNMRVEVPELTGALLPMALNKMKNIHSQGKTIEIQPGVISYIPSDKQKENVVIAQSPVQGTRISPDQRINLLVSSGTDDKNTRMPALNGQTIDLCYDLLRAMGAEIITDVVETGDIRKSGVVLSHSPYKGAYINEKSTVRLKVYYHPMKDHPYHAYERYTYHIPEEQGSGLYEAYVEDDNSRRIRFSGQLNGGKTISFIFHRHGNAKIIILKDKKQVRVSGIEVDEFE